jgi:hypothetical protein
VSSTLTLTGAQPGDAGYYRLIVADAGNINSYNCRAMSRVVRLSIITAHDAAEQHPDIRIQVCAGIGEINLSKYIDTTGFEWVKWYTASPLSPPVGENTGLVNSAGFVYPNTYGYKYHIKNSCFEPEGRLYVKTISDAPLGLPPVEVIVCWEDAAALSLDRILGLEAKGQYIPVEEAPGDLSAHMETLAAPRAQAGAVLFDGKAAYAALSSPYYRYNSDPDVKKLSFKYRITDPASCLNGQTYSINIILTDDMTK